MPLENIVIVRDNLLQCFAQVEQKTILHHVDETHKKRLASKEFRKPRGDGSVYVVEKKEPIFYLIKLPDNVVLNNIEEAVKQIKETRNYKPNYDDVKRTIKAKTSLRIPLSMLTLERYNDECGYFTIHNTLKPMQRTFKERVHGSGKQFSKVTEMLANNSIKETRIYTLNPHDYVKEHAKDNAIARLCWLSLFDTYSIFDADGRLVDYGNGILQWVYLKKVAEGDARENTDPFADVKAALGVGKIFEYKNKIYIPADKSAGVKI